MVRFVGCRAIFAVQADCRSHQRAKSMASADRFISRICMLVLAIAGSGCGRHGQPDGAMPPGAESSTAKQRPLRIAAASDLQHALPRIAERFRQRTGTTTTLTLDASGRLAEQIKAGAPFDVFLA